MIKVLAKLQKAWSWLVAWFVLRQIEATKVEQEIKPERKKRASKQKAFESLSGLLDQIEQAFDSVTAPIESCELDHSSRIGLRRLGPHVIPSDGMIFVPGDAGTRVKFDDKNPASSMIFIHCPQETDGTRSERLWSIEFYYAIRLDKPPINVERRFASSRDYFYSCGVGLRNTMHRRVFWTNFYLRISRQSGELDILKQLCNEPVVIRPTREVYTRRVWDVPTTYNFSHMGVEDLKRFVVMCFVTWRQRGQMWSVSVRNRGLRATFCILPKGAPGYFKDREKTALTPTGKRKTIIHIVREHERQVKDGTTTVKQHIRGIRTFDWRGYACAVTAPKWHRFTAHEVDITTTEVEEEQIPKGYIDSSKFGGMVADLEDNQRLH